MWLLPYQRVALRTQVPAELVLQRLGADVEPARWPRRSSSLPHKAFEGRVLADGFKLMRIIRGRNSWLPVLVGRMRSDGAGSVLEVTLRLNHLVAAFMVFWLGAVGIGGGGEALRAMSSRGASPWVLLPPAGMFAAGYLAMQWSFLIEAKIAVRFLEEVTREGGP